MSQSAAVTYQLQAVAIAAKVKNNQDFARLVLSNPIQALKDEGLDNDSIREMLNEEAFFRGHVNLAPVADCTAVSGCLCTECCVSCWIGSSGRQFGDLVLPAEDLVLGAPDHTLPNVSPERELLLQRLVDNGFIRSPH